MKKQNLKTEYNAAVVNLIADFLIALEMAAPERLSSSTARYACEDGRIGGLLGIRLNIEMNDGEWDEIDALIADRRRGGATSPKIRISSATSA